MEYWFQRVLLTLRRSLFIICCINVHYVLAEEAPQQNPDSIETEYFDIGLFTGVLNIEDFSSELVYGMNITFNANENYFIQFNYLSADTGLSSFEESQGQLLTGSDRSFNHFDFLLGYNLFLGDHFTTDTVTRLSSLYLVSGVGDTDFGGEESFTFTMGLGYQIALKRNILLRVDYRDYIYKTNIIGENNSTHNTQLTAGVSYLF